MITPDSAVPPTSSEHSVQPAPLLFSAEQERGERIPVPSAQRPESDAVHSRGAPRVGGAVGWISIGLVLLVTFLSASFAVRNSDFWLHLATGRLVARGEYHVGVDPFAYTTEGIYWVNHSWLFDLVVYLVYTILGGAWLVILKSLILTLLAGVLIQMRRPNSGVGLPTACTCLAILAMTPRFFLQSACLSYLFLGVTLWILWRPHANSTDASSGASAGSRSGASEMKDYGPLLPLFALWVNVDAWFLLGPLLVGLFALGERLQAFLPVGTRGGRTWRTPIWVLPASIAACLLNPHHVHAFTLPVELSPVVHSAGLENDPRFYRLFASPWELGVRWQPAAAISLAEWAYFLLVGVGLISFLLNRKNLSAWRLLVWVCFGLLGAWQMRTVPFFAVVAGPITALNLQDYLSRRAAAVSQSMRREPAGWLAGGLAFVAEGLLLVLLAWPGWLLGFQRDDRHVSFDVRPDPSLRHVAETIALWRGQERLRDNDRAFAMHPDVADYFAWFCPQERSFFDRRFSLFSEAAGEYESVCHELNPDLGFSSRSAAEGGGQEKAAHDWQTVLRDRGVSLVILYDPDARYLLPALNRLAKDPEHWTLLHIDGQALVFGWNESRDRAGADRFGRLRFDPERAVFAAMSEEREIPPAPGIAPARGPSERDLWTRFFHGPPQPVWESPAASALMRYQVDAALAQRERDRAEPWAGYAAGLAGLPALPGNPLAIPATFVLRGRLPTLFRADTARLPAVPLLAVRSARCALVADPDDGNAYLRLGQGYLALEELPGGRPMRDEFPPLGMLRHVQIVAALEHCLIVNPDQEAAHEALAKVYLERQCLDIALDHRGNELRLTRRAGARRGESVNDFQSRVDAMEKGLRSLEDIVQDRQEKFGRRSQELSGAPLEKALLALDLGLPRQALEDVLLRFNVVLFGTAGARLELELFLTLGRAEEARTRLDDPDLQAMKNGLGTFDLPVNDPTGGSQTYRFPAFEWLRACQAAATGDYDQGARALADIREILRHEEQSNLKRLQHTTALTVASELGFMARPDALLFQVLLEDSRGGLAEAYDSTLFLRAEQANLHAVAGVLAIEQGRSAEAKRQFEDALTLCRRDAVPAVRFAGRPLAEAQLRRFQDVEK